VPVASDAWMIAVARRIGDLRNEFVFVGGAVLSLLIDDPGTVTVRPTNDLDVIAIVDGHASLAEEIEDASDALRNYLMERIGTLGTVPNQPDRFWI